VLTAKTLYDTLPTDFLDVADRLTTIAGLEKWKGTFVCTKAGTFKAAEFHFKRTEDADSVQLNLIYTTEPIPGYVHEPFYFFDLASFADAAPFIESNDRLTATFFDGEFVLSYSETGEELTFVRK